MYNYLFWALNSFFDIQKTTTHEIYLFQSPSITQATEAESAPQPGPQNDLPVPPNESDSACSESESDEEVHQPAEVPAKKRKKTKTRGPPKFPRKWLSEHQWLKYDVGLNRMFCRICTKFQKSGVFVNGGTDNFR